MPAKKGAKKRSGLANRDRTAVIVTGPSAEEMPL